MTDDSKFLVDGQLITPDECKRLFAGKPLQDRQERVLSLIEGDRIVDIGCYAGSFVAEAARRHPEKTILGVDYFPDHIRMAHHLHPSLRERFSLMSVYALTLEDGSVDCVTAQEVLEHLEGAALAVKEINRILRPGGVAIISVPNPFYWRDSLRFVRFELRNALRRMRKAPPHLGTEVFFDSVEWNRHVYSWTPQTLLTLFAVNGFEYQYHEYSVDEAGLFARIMLRGFRFLGPTQILKVRKIRNAPTERV